MGASSSPEITQSRVTAYEVPTETPESDGTLEWSSTTLVLVELAANDVTGMGYTYADRATALLVKDKLLPLLYKADPLGIPELRTRLASSLRNLGQTGISAMALSAIDNALWDLKARLLKLSLIELLGRARPRILAYASGGFTNQNLSEIAAQVEHWYSSGYRAIKIKIGREPDNDEARVRTAREHLPDDCALYVDANGAYNRQQALHFAEIFSTYGVTWFEEPVRSTDLEGLNLLRNRSPAGINISAGEYGWDEYYFRRMLAANAVDILQADATRCGGISGFLQAGTFCKAHDIPLSSHCAPALHAHACCAASAAYNLECFYDHVRIENMLFEGVPEVVEGYIIPTTEKAGYGLQLKKADAAPYEI